MDWKAIAIGFVATMILELCMQLVYMLIAALIGTYSTSLPVVAQHKETLWLAGAFFSFAITMVLGGAITMMVARTRRLVNPFIVGILVTSVSVAASLGYNELTPKSVLLVCTGALFSILGGHFIRRRDNDEIPSESSA